jgi:integrase
LDHLRELVRRDGPTRGEHVPRLPLANVKTDRRKTRRALPEAELGKLLNVARDRALNARLKERLDGKPAILSPAYRATLERNGRIRALIYKTFILTGLRFDELRSLTVGDVRFDGTPRIELPAAKEKNRKGSRIPLRPDLADDLKAYLDERTREAQTAIHARERFLPVPLHLVRHLKEDLKAAGIPTVDERGHILDIHALRHTFNTLLAKGGVNQRIAQELMRHSDPRLTANVYTDLGIGDTSGALHALPALPLHVGPIRPVALDLVPPSQNQSIRVIEHDTGTDGDQWNETLKIAGYVNEKCPESTPVNSGQAIVKTTEKVAAIGFEPTAGSPKTLQFKAKTHGRDSGCSSGCSNSTESPDLARVVAAWPALHEPVRLAILALVDSAPAVNRRAA